MKKGLVYLLIALMASASMLIINPQGAQAATPIEIQWTNTYGEPANQTVYSVVQTSDGGYAIASSNSLIIGVNRFGVALLVKTDSIGNPIWNASYDLGQGSSLQEVSLIQTNDKGYAIACTASYNGGSMFYPFALLIKTDALGNHLWNYSISPYSSLCSVLQTGDGGLVWGGYTFFRFPGNPFNNVWLNKTDLSGNQIWSRTYGEGFAYSLLENTDGGFALAVSRSPPFGSAGLIVTDSAGNQLFWKNIQPSPSIIQTSEGGYALLAGDSSLFKYDSSGSLQWNQTHGLYINALVQTDDGGYLLAGEGELAKTDSLGNLQWFQQFTNVSLACIAKTIDGGYALAGTYTTGGNSSSWLTKISLNPIPTPTPTSQPPSPTPTAPPTSTPSASPTPTAPSPTDSPAPSTTPASTPTPQNTLSPSPTPSIPEIPFAAIMLPMAIALVIGTTAVVLRKNNKQS